MIDAVAVGIVQSTVIVKMGIFPIQDCRLDINMARILPSTIMTIMGEIDTVETDTVQARHHFIVVEVKEMTTTETTHVKGNDVTMITTTTEAVRGVTAEAEKEGEIADAIERIDLVGIDLETDTKNPEIDREKDTEIDRGLEKGLVKDPGTGIEIVGNPVTDLVIKTDLVTEEKGTTKTTDHVDAVVKVRTI